MSDVEPLMLTYDASPPDGHYGAIVGFVAGGHAIALGQLSLEVVAARVPHTPSEREREREYNQTCTCIHIPRRLRAGWPD
jgi:hypothetical protein